MRGTLFEERRPTPRGLRDPGIPGPSGTRPIDGRLGVGGFEVPRALAFSRAGIPSGAGHVDRERLDYLPKAGIERGVPANGRKPGKNRKSGQIPELARPPSKEDTPSRGSPRAKKMKRNRYRPGEAPSWDGGPSSVVFAASIPNGGSGRQVSGDWSSSVERKGLDNIDPEAGASEDGPSRPRP
jgi:hypothetical protein